jgi:hypothetical protein
VGRQILLADDYTAEKNRSATATRSAPRSIVFWLAQSQMSPLEEHGVHRKSISNGYKIICSNMKN